MAGATWSKRNILNVKRWLMIDEPHGGKFSRIWLNDTIRGIYYNENFMFFLRIKTVFEASDEGILAVH